MDPTALPSLPFQTTISDLLEAVPEQWSSSTRSFHGSENSYTAVEKLTEKIAQDRRRWGETLPCDLGKVSNSFAVVFYVVSRCFGLLKMEPSCLKIF